VAILAACHSGYNGTVRLVINGVLGEINHRFFIAPFSFLKEETHLLCYILRAEEYIRLASTCYVRT